MKTALISIITLLLLITINGDLKSQYYPDGYNGETFDVGETYDNPGDPFQGWSKPNRTDLSGGLPAPSDAYFPVLIVFVQFKDEYSVAHNSWPTGSEPNYLSDMIATDKNDVGDWWNFYNNQTEMLSSHWMEISRGKFHVIGDAYSVVLPMTAQEYWTASGQNHGAAELMIHRDIWNNLIQQNLVDWRRYDRWKEVNDVFYYTPLGEGDGYVDMIYKVHKSTGGILYPAAGYNILGPYSPVGEDIVDPVNNIKVDYYGANVSGVTLSFHGQLSDYIMTMGHEHGHHLFMNGHVTYSRASYGFGFEGFYSPYDMILNEYMTPSNAVFGETNYLEDYSSRNAGDGELLKIPVQGNEFFLLAHRTKVSKWDRVMLGDNTPLNPYEDNTDNGKGLYIYHVENGVYFPGSDVSPQDMECADGYYDWEYVGQSYVSLFHTCFQSGPIWKYFKKTNVLYDNDPSILSSSVPKGDGISFHYYSGSYNSNKWWGIGKREVDPCSLGVNRLNTNSEEIYSMGENGGDRFDPWHVGYNEVFSYYSSPSTRIWNASPPNDNSGIFIYLKAEDGGTAEIDIYRASEYGGETPLSEILEATPPSRPMGLKIEEYYPGNCCHPWLKWEHNKEPDMNRSGNPEEMIKRYAIYRSEAPNMNSVPPDAMINPENVYTQIDEVDIYDNGQDKAEYTDFSVNLYDCSLCDQPPYGTPYPVRYRVQAIDKDDMTSVLSDFASEVGTKEEGGTQQGQGENPIFSNNEIPDVFNLYQNFPNPFNPVTNIQFDLPNDVKVLIKVYDVLGKEVATLVNEFKKAGSYIVSFNGSKLSSGVYFYKIEAGSFSDIKRMVLIK